MEEYALGVDFGTESARAVLVNVKTGEVLSTSTYVYPSGVIERTLPGFDLPLPDNWSLQNPRDWLTAMQTTILNVLADVRARPECVVGLGIDFTASTLLPTREDGTPLCEVEGYRHQPHAWPKLWKHHSAQLQADRITETARQRGENWLARSGGVIDPEWVVPKALEILEEAPEIYNAAERLVEAADWIPWQLTGNLMRNTNTAEFKAHWSREEGFPSVAYLSELNPGLAELFTKKLSGTLIAPGRLVGGLSSRWAQLLGMKEGTPVAAPIIDSHAAMLGGSRLDPSTLCLVMGTSNVFLCVVPNNEVLVTPGIFRGEGLIPTSLVLEAGQAGVGSLFAWFARNAAPAAYNDESNRRKLSIHQLLTEKARALKPGASGLVAIDWWNGCRAPLVNADLRGIIVGFSLNTVPEEIYRSLVEATAFGARRIVQLLQDANPSIRLARALGGLTKNEMVLEIYADVLGLPVEIVDSQQSSAIGAAILGAIAGGVFQEAQSAGDVMAAKPVHTILPREDFREIYADLYAEYIRMADFFGRQKGSTFGKLKALM